MYDVVVIGGGSGGYAAAIRAAQLGGKVALIEAEKMGGTCVNRGCIPSKVWLRAVELLHRVQNGDEFGLKTSKVRTDFAAIVGRKTGVASDICMGMEALLGNNGVEVIKGKGVLKGPEEIEVDGNHVSARKIIIATGSRLREPEFPGLEKSAITTDQVLDMTQAPASILICNADYIEIEMAYMLRILGSEVTLVTESARILPREDSETSQRMAQSLRAIGVNILTRVTLESVEEKPDGALCRLGGKSEQNMTVDKVLLSKRVPNTDDMGLEALGIKLNDDQGIQVDDYLQSSLAGIYAIGDATGGWMLSHAASSMAVFAAENAMNQNNRYPFHLIPRCLWTRPEMAAVGLSEDEAEDQGFDVTVGSFPYPVNGLAMVHNEVDGAVKIVSDERYGAILGVHIVGTHATEVIGEAVLAMQLEATVQELARSIRVHPTFSEAVVDAARDVKGWALYLPRS